MSTTNIILNVIRCFKLKWKLTEIFPITKMSIQITNVKMNQERGFSNTGQINEMLIKNLSLLTFIYVKVTGRGQVTNIGTGVWSRSAVMFVVLADARGRWGWNLHSKKDFLKCERKASSCLLHHLLTQNCFKSHIIQLNKNA